MAKRQKRQARVWSFLLVLLLVLQDGAAVTARAETGYTSGVLTMQTGMDREEEKTEAAEEDEKDASDSGKTEDTKTEDTEKTDTEETDPEETETEKNPESGKEEEKEERPEKDPEEGETEEVSGNDASDREDPEQEEPDSGVSENDVSDNDVSGNDIPDVSENDPALREPENYYPEGEEEDYGELVAYDAHSRTYLTGEAPAAAGQNEDAEGETGRQKASYVTVIGPSAHHYLDEEGELQRTDNTLSAGPAARYALGSVRYENGNGPMTVSLPEKLSG